VLYQGGATSHSGPLTLTATGTYFLIASDGGDVPSDYSFRLLDVAAAGAVTSFPTSVSGALVPGGSDLVRITAAAGQRLYVHGTEGGFAGSYVLYDPANRSQGSQSIGSDQEWTLTQGGDYILAVQNNSSDPTDYLLRLLAPVPTVTAYALGTAVSDSLAGQGDEKDYTFTGSAGQRLYFQGESSASAVTLHLLRPAG
jgi:hypothetical protein